MSDNTADTVISKDSAPSDNKKEVVSNETQKVLERSQFIQAEIQGSQLENIKSVYDFIKDIDKKKSDEIEKNFGEGIIQLEEIDEDGNVKPFTVAYVPLTTRAEEAVNKVIREIKTFKADIEKKLPLEDLQKKYTELMDGIESLEELAPDIEKIPMRDDKGNIMRDKKGNTMEETKTKDSEAFLTLIENYIIKKKAKIYFKINDIGNFSRKDLRSLIFLYQYRNTYNPYYVNPT
jgi:hypothetical protein